jgi:hypothetical protein
MARFLIRTAFLVAPLVLALGACIGPSRLERIAEDLNDARTATTLEARVVALESAEAEVKGAGDNPTGEVAEWVQLLLVGLLGAGGGMAGGAAIKGRNVAQIVAAAAGSLPNRAPNAERSSVS